MNIIRYVKECIEVWKLVRMAKSALSKNKKPRTYKMWKYNSWGNAIYIVRVNHHHTFSIFGFLQNRPRVGDIMLYDSQGGGVAKGVVVDVKYESNPPDMFFAEVAPYSIWKSV